MQIGETMGSESVSERGKTPGFYRDDRESYFDRSERS